MLQVNRMFLRAEPSISSNQDEIRDAVLKDFGSEVGCCLREFSTTEMKPGSWRTGLCGCWSCPYNAIGFGLALQSILPCCAHVATIERLELADNLLLLCCGYLLCPCCLCFPCLFFRHSYAKNLKLPEGRWFCGIVDTCCIVFFCFPCSVGQIQLDYEIRKRENRDASLFIKAETWHDYVDLWCGVIRLKHKPSPV